jgi:hypothetical protein
MLLPTDSQGIKVKLYRNVFTFSIQRPSF